MILPDVITPRLAGVALELEAGDVAVLSSSVFHTSRPNTSAAPRRIHLAQYSLGPLRWGADALARARLAQGGAACPPAAAARAEPSGLPPLVLAVPARAGERGLAAAAAGGDTAALNGATRVEARTCGDSAAGLLAASSWLRAARQAGSPLVLRRLGARLPCVREWAAAPAQALAARGGALGVRAFVSSSGRLWLDGSNAPQAVLSASMSAETSLGAFLGGNGGGGGGGGLAARWAHRYLVKNLDGGDFGIAEASGAAAALRAATCGEATDALLAAFDAPPVYQKLFVAAGRTRTQARELPSTYPAAHPHTSRFRRPPTGASVAPQHHRHPPPDSRLPTPATLLYAASRLPSTPTPSLPTDSAAAS